MKRPNFPIVRNVQVQMRIHVHSIILRGKLALALYILLIVVTYTTPKIFGFGVVKINVVRASAAAPLPPGSHGYIHMYIISPTQ